MLAIGQCNLADEQRMVGVRSAAKRTLVAVAANATSIARRFRIGRRAERRAERFLRRKGLRTLTRNYARRSGEIDLVMVDGETLVFVEVRYRGPGAWGGGLESVDRRKQRRLARTAALYLDDHPAHRFREARFDVVAASSANYGIACEWIPNAFEATDC